MVLQKNQVPQKIKSLVWIVPFPDCVLAVNYLSLFRMQFQSTLLKALFDDRLDPSGLFLAFAMHQNVIGVTFKRYVVIVAPHPFVKFVVQKQIRAYVFSG